MTEQNTAAVRLLGYSFLILFFELALIRFIPASVRATAYFINLTLIAAFLGMGVGLILEKRRLEITILFAPLLLVLVAACAYFSNIIVDVSQLTDEFLWPTESISPTSRKWGVVPTVALFFVLSTMVFVPLGLGVAREFGKFPPLVAYCINILGSVLGLVAFAVLSQLSTPPLVWFTLGVLCFLTLCRAKRDFIICLICFPAIVSIVNQMHVPDKELWSPYYKISYIKRPHLVVLSVNGSFHQYILNFSEEILSRSKFVSGVKKDFLRPYRFVKNLDNVLILGAGTGNDVVMALQQNARQIDAVEIDAQILRLGRELNFQKPYDDPRVTVYVDDARAFLKKTDRKYDVIVLGTLDSHTLLSGMSSLRLDNYVYTVESFQSIKDHLKPNGVLILYHMSPQPQVLYRIYAALYKVFGYPPLVNLQSPHRLFNYTLVAGTQEKDAAKEFISVDAETDPADGKPLFAHQPATDDWPYLYLKQPGIPAHYLWVGGMIAIFSIVMVGLALGKENRKNPDGALFFLGAGFLLLETKSVTEMSLLFGSTWQVNILVFLSILLIVLAANLVILKYSGLKKEPVFVALFGLIIISYFVPVEFLLNFSLPGQWLLGGILVASPLFFAGMVFALIFKTRAHPVKALGYNLIGAILGGLLEYSSMVVGVKQLYLISLLMYFLAYFFHNREPSSINKEHGGLPL